MAQESENQSKPKGRMPILPLTYFLLLVGGVVLVMYGSYGIRHGEDAAAISEARLAFRIGWLVLAVSAMIPLTLISFGLFYASQQIMSLLTAINERLLLSEYTRRIGYRKRDRQVLRQAIAEDIDEGDYDSALVLASQLGTMYGHQIESEEYRQKILGAREQAHLIQIQNAVKDFEGMLDKAEWETAAKTAGKLQRMYPDSPMVEGLGDRVRAAKDEHKHALEKKFLQAAERDDIDNAMGLLGELDKYLTPAEAEPLRETARGVIGKKRDNLGVQFKMAAHDKDWIMAVRIGEQIIREFPNTTMADEVRGLIDMLRKRANEQQAARGPAEKTF